MKQIVLHCCCAPCSLSCVEPLRAQGIEPVALWYNPNIHPWQEYRARRDCLIEHARQTGLEVRVLEEYGLRAFVRRVAGESERCAACYAMRLDVAARYAAENGFDAFTTTLLASTYQDHELIARVGQACAQEHGVAFAYFDFRPYFREGNRRAREIGLYMQKYCGCIFSEEERYQKQIARDRERFI